LNPIKKVWPEKKRIMAENWPDPSPTSTNTLWDFVLDAWEQVAHSEGYASTTSQVTSSEDADGD
jgi:hypothetical protein